MWTGYGIPKSGEYSGGPLVFRTASSVALRIALPGQATLRANSQDMFTDSPDGIHRSTLLWSARMGLARAKKVVRHLDDSSPDNHPFRRNRVSVDLAVILLDRSNIVRSCVITTAWPSRHTSGHTGRSSRSKSLRAGSSEFRLRWSRYYGWGSLQYRTGSSPHHS